MHYKTFYITLCALLAINMVFAQQTSSLISKRELDDWYAKKEWIGKTTLIADSSINKGQLYIQYHKHPERWKIAFDFLKNADLNALEVGDHELDGKNVFIKVSTYHTADRKDAFYELHRHYVDIHYVISGEEYIDTRNSEGMKLETPYEAARDIEFYSEYKTRHHLAAPGRFFIFFPSELHRPGMMAETDTLVKKVVIKVLCDD